MNNSITSPSPRGRRVIHTTAAVITVGALLAGTACNSDDDAAPAPTTAAPTGPAPPISVAPSQAPPMAVAPPTTQAPTPSAPPTSSAPHSAPSKEDRARRALLRRILASHRAEGEFVGARIAVLDPEGTVTEVSAGTPTVDPASGPVDPGIAWNIGSATKPFLAVVVLQLADEGLIDLDDGIERFLPDLPSAELITPRQLLQHTSGLGEYLDQPAVREHTARHWTAAELIAVAEASRSDG